MAESELSSPWRRIIRKTTANVSNTGALPFVARLSREPIIKARITSKGASFPKDRPCANRGMRTDAMKTMAATIDICTWRVKPS